MSFKRQLLLLVICACLGVIATVIQPIMHSLENEKALKKDRQLLNIADVANHLVHNLQLERGISCVFLNSDGEKFKERLIEQRSIVDQHIQNYRHSLVTQQIEQIDPRFQEDAKHIANNLAQIAETRIQIDKQKFNYQQVLDYYSALNAELLHLTVHISTFGHDPIFAAAATDLSLILYSKEVTGIERALQSIALTNQSISPDIKQNIRNYKNQSYVYITLLANRSIDENTSTALSLIDNKLQKEVNIVRQAILDADTASESGINPEYSFDLMTKYIACLKESSDSYANILKRANEDSINAAAASTRSEILNVLIIFCVIAIVSRLTSKAIANKLMQNAEDLERGIDSVFCNANNVLSANHHVAQSSTEQAASVEQISSAIVEMDAISRDNADRCKTAANDTRLSIHSAKEAQNAVVSLNQTMQDINSNANKTNSIIQTINEIAFQTNLLALNAAVEAARAGEAGKGFAVVAEEVRSLAARASEAAQQTEALIKESQKSAIEGSNRTNKVMTDLGEIANSLNALGMAIEGVATSSDQQSTSVQELSLAVNQINEATQSNAESSESAAQSSENLHQVTNELRSVKERLVVYLGRQH